MGLCKFEGCVIMLEPELCPQCGAVLEIKMDGSTMKAHCLACCCYERIETAKFLHETESLRDRYRPFSAAASTKPIR